MLNQVKGNAGSVKHRIDAKNDYHRLMNEAAETGADLEVSQESL